MKAILLAVCVLVSACSPRIEVIQNEGIKCWRIKGTFWEMDGFWRCDL